MITAINLERSPPIEEVIASGVVPRFVEFLTREDYPQLQVRYSWIDRKDPFFIVVSINFYPCVPDLDCMGSLKQLGR